MGCVHFIKLIFRVHWIPETIELIGLCGLSCSDLRLVPATVMSACVACMRATMVPTTDRHPRYARLDLNFKAPR